MRTYVCTNCGHQIQRPTQPFNCPQCGRQAVNLFRPAPAGPAPGQPGYPQQQAPSGYPQPPGQPGHPQPGGPSGHPQAPAQPGYPQAPGGYPPPGAPGQPGQGQGGANYGPPQQGPPSAPAYGPQPPPGQQRPGAAPWYPPPGQPAQPGPQQQPPSPPPHGGSPQPGGAVPGGAIRPPQYGRPPDPGQTGFGRQPPGVQQPGAPQQPHPPGGSGPYGQSDGGSSYPGAGGPPPSGAAPSVPPPGGAGFPPGPPPQAPPAPQGPAQHQPPPQGAPQHPQSPQGAPQHPQPPQGAPQHPQPPQGAPQHPQPPQGPAPHQQPPQGPTPQPPAPQGTPPAPQGTPPAPEESPSAGPGRFPFAKPKGEAPQPPGPQPPDRPPHQPPPPSKPQPSDAPPRTAAERGPAAKQPPAQQPPAQQPRSSRYREPPTTPRPKPRTEPKPRPEPGAAERRAKPQPSAGAPPAARERPKRPKRPEAEKPAPPEPEKRPEPAPPKPKPRPKPIRPEQFAWAYPDEPPLEDGVPLRAPPVVDASGRIFLHFQNRLLALKPADGKPVVEWEYVTGARVPGPLMTAADGSLRMHAADGFLHAISPEDGKQLWPPVHVGEPLGYAAPLVDAVGNTYVSALDGGLLRVDEDGRCDQDRPYFRSRQKLNSTGIIHRGVLYIGSEEGYVFAVELGDRRGRNRFDHAADQGHAGWFINCALAMAEDGTIVVAGRDDTLYGFAPGGKTAWKTAMPGQMLGSPVLDARGHVYVGVAQSQRGQPSRGKLLSIDGNSHKIRWQADADDAVESTPVIGDDETIYFGDNAGVIHAVDLRGASKWKAKVHAPVRSAGTLVGPGQVAFGLEDETLVVLKCSSQKLPEAGWPKLAWTPRYGGPV